MPVTELGTKADPNVDQIWVDGRPLSQSEEKVYIVVNKPLGFVTTVRDPHAKQTIMDLVKEIPQRIYPVGRLDADSAGLLIMSNDGEFTQQLTHPSHQVPKTYRAVVRGEVSEWSAADLSKGVLLDDGMTAPAQVEWVDFDDANNASIIDVTIHEGRNRQVRRMFDAVGHPVLALTRMQIGPIKLKGIAPGKWRRLRLAEVQALLDSADTRAQELPQIPSIEPSLTEEIQGPAPRKSHPQSRKRPPTSAPDAEIAKAAKALTLQLNAPQRFEAETRPKAGNTRRPSSKSKPPGRKS